MYYVNVLRGNVKEEMTVVSFRVPKALKERMKSTGKNWSKNVRKFIDEEVKRHERKKVLDEIEASFKSRSTIKAGTAAKLVREDRDSH